MQPDCRDTERQTEKKKLKKKCLLGKSIGRWTFIIRISYGNRENNNETKVEKLREKAATTTEVVLLSKSMTHYETMLH